jgi:hypothetical protein
VSKNHQLPDRVPLDLGASATTGMHTSSVYLLRRLASAMKTGKGNLAKFGTKWWLTFRIGLL